MHTFTCNVMNCRKKKQRVERDTSFGIGRIFQTARMILNTSPLCSLTYVTIYQTTRNHTALSQEISPRIAINIHHV